MHRKHSQKLPDASTGNDIVRANLNREIVQASDFSSLYANDMQVQISPWDVRLIFGVIQDLPTAKRKTVVVKQLSEVRMSPQFAKKVVEILTQQLKQYEEAVGIIPQPQ